MLEQKIAEMSKLAASQNPQIPLIPPPKPLKVHEGDISGNFNFFKLQWDNYIIASGIASQTEEVKISILLSTVGEDCLRMIQNFPLSTEDKATSSTLLAAIGRNMTPTVNIRYERAVFNMAHQEESETYDAYINRLRGLIKNCQYGAIEDDLLLDKIICSIKSVSLREQLWAVANITLVLAIDKCKAKELKQLKDIAGESSRETEDISRIKTRSKPFRKAEILCKYCGRQHEYGIDACPAKGAQCLKCGKSNHFAQVCRARPHQGAYRKPSRIREVQYLDSDSTDCEYVMQSSHNNSKLLTATLEIHRSTGDKINTVCMLDTGPTCNIVGNLCGILNDNNPHINPSGVTLRGFDGSPSKPIGKFTLKCTRNSKKI